MPEDVEGTTLFLDGNLIQSVLWKPLKQVTDKPCSANDILERICKRVHSRFNLSTELGSPKQILGQVPCNSSCRVQQSDKVAAQVSMAIHDLMLNNFRI